MKSVARSMYMKYKCSFYFMALDGVLEEFESYGIDKDVVDMWTQEFINNCINNIDCNNAHRNVMDIMHVGKSLNGAQFERLTGKLREISHGITDTDIILICEDIKHMIDSEYDIYQTNARYTLYVLIGKVRNVNKLSPRYKHGYHTIANYIGRE